MRFLPRVGDEKPLLSEKYAATLECTGRGERLAQGSFVACIIYEVLLIQYSTVAIVARDAPCTVFTI